MRNFIYSQIVFCLTLWLSCSYTSSAQSVVTVGSGSYASQPLNNEYIANDPANGTFVDFATNSANIDVHPSKINDPIPTNDWWTGILTMDDGNGNRLGGNLWTYPLLSRFSANGFEVGNRLGKWASDATGSTSISVDYLVGLTGDGFTPTKAIAMDWSDWQVELRAQVGDDDTERIDVTLAQGMPFVWAKTTGFTPVVSAVHVGVRNYYDASGNPLSFPITTDRFIIEYDGNLYGIHLQEQVYITENATSGLNLNSYEEKWVVFSALNQVSDLNFLHSYAFVRPTDTKLNYTYDPSQGKITTQHVVTTDVITGSETNVLQGFIPHHYRGNANQFSFVSAVEYVGTPRGTLKLAKGNSLSFEYEFNADILPHFNAPKVDPSNSITYDNAIMKSIIDGYTSNVSLYGINGGTYWGGKSLLRALKYALMAKETENENFETLLATTKAEVYNWLTYTPGETDHYYTYYDAWKALVGFDEEYYSAYFTDNHFHYGYLVHAAALLEIAEPGAMDGYWDMITKIIKTYANWDRTDTEFPYLRTFSPWMGHSMASGLGNAIGNNQESSSEAMQSWAGMFMVGEMTENTNMRDAAAFGYLTESRAIADYWYNESGVFQEIGYTKPVTGILEMNRYVYGTFFGAQESYIHGIQWLPITPAYGFWNDFLTVSEANAIVDPIINNMATDLGTGLSPDWMNVCMGFKLFFDPEAVVSQFDGYWNAANGSDEYQVAHTNGENGITYYYAHATQNLGLRQSSYRLSLPLSSAFLKDGVMTYVVYNPTDRIQTCEVYDNNTSITSFDVPANSLITANNNGIIDETPSDNLALDGTASQSSTAHSGNAFRAIDGNTNGEWNNSSVTHTNNEANAWWQVTLEQEKLLGDIVIYNRTNCCMDRLDNFTVYVIDDNNNTTFSQSFTNHPNPSLTVDAAGALGRIVKIQLDDTNPLSLAEVEVYEYEAPIIFPDPTKKYYIDCPVHDLRIAASGESEDPYTTATYITGDDVEWVFVQHTNGHWHIQRADGGSIPRLQSDNSNFADMEATTSSGAYTYFELTDGFSTGTYFVTLPDGPTAHSRLQMDGLGELRMVSTASNRSWESFTFTEVEETYSSFIEAEDYTSMSGIQTSTTTDVNGGDYVGWVNPTDWMEYQVDIPSAGYYTVDFRLASLNGSAGFDFQVDGQTEFSVSVNATNGWDTWYTTSESVYFSAGNHTIRLYAQEGGWNINWLEINTGSASSARIISESSVSNNQAENILSATTSNHEAIKIFPNPVKNILQVSLGNSVVSNIEIIDAVGHTYLIENISESTQFDISSLPQGFYFVRFLNNGVTLAVRTMIKNE